MPTRIKLGVKLHVCPACHRVGGLPGDTYGGKVFCVGPKGQLHKRTAMALREFREVSA